MCIRDSSGTAGGAKVCGAVTGTAGGAKVCGAASGSSDEEKLAALVRELITTMKNQNA